MNHSLMISEETEKYSAGLTFKTKTDQIHNTFHSNHGSLPTPVSSSLDKNKQTLQEDFLDISMSHLLFLRQGNENRT